MTEIDLAQSSEHRNWPTALLCDPCQANVSFLTNGRISHCVLYFMALFLTMVVCNCERFDNTKSQSYGLVFRVGRLTTGCNTVFRL